MIVITNFWAKVERLLWVVYLWAGLTVFALAITDLAIFQGWSAIVINVCPLWLGIMGFGYLATGIALQSRILFIIGIIQTSAIVILPYLISWQFLITGMLMGGSLLLLAEFQWDMRPPITSARLTEEQKQFNLKQYSLRRSKLPQKLV